MNRSNSTEAMLRAEIERLREACEWWAQNRHSWFRAAMDAEARALREAAALWEMPPNAGGPAYDADVPHWLRARADERESKP